jgi:hypothetical protein
MTTVLQTAVKTGAKNWIRVTPDSLINNLLKCAANLGAGRMPPIKEAQLL